MWEHKTVSNKEMKATGRMNPSETYVRLMDEVEEAVSTAQIDEFAHESFLEYPLVRGPWEELPETDMAKQDPRSRYIGPAKAKLLSIQICI